MPQTLHWIRYHNVFGAPDHSTRIMYSSISIVVTVQIALALFSSAGQAQDNPISLVTSPRFTLGTESNRSASVRLGDLDGDGDLDAVVANGRHWPGQNFLFLNQGKAKFTVMRPLGTDRVTTYACELADLDGDGDLDIATGNDMARGRIFLNDGKANFSEHAQYGEVASVRSLTLADIDVDGDMDILSTCRGMQNRIYLNDGKANFQAGGIYGNSRDSTIDVAVGDLNHDGHPDLVLANRDGQVSELLLNDGKLNFTEKKSFAHRQEAGEKKVIKCDSRAVAVVDMNGDGKLDWIMGNIGHPNTIFFGDGSGGVLKSVAFGESSRTYTLAVADMDNDGDLDIVTGNAGQKNRLFINKGDGSEFTGVNFGTRNSATYGVAVGDLSGNGFADIATANSDALNFLFLNRGKQ